MNHIDSEHLYNSPSSLAGYSDKMLELLLFALKGLKMALKSQESDTMLYSRLVEPSRHGTDKATSRD